MTTLSPALALGDPVVGGEATLTTVRAGSHLEELAATRSLQTAAAWGGRQFYSSVPGWWPSSYQCSPWPTLRCMQEQEQEQEQGSMSRGAGTGE